ncbi:MAG: formate dehydrogenase accessory sulfurtransferase FdhD [Paracoccaceae bacterium]|jgi:FdhD protein|uniref:formate dehydrogenase accessory sulfurtransferase FdhD n=1 Tax=unclassified Seohaeicola TaxID=2641111 RepID=UPI00237BBD4C|nr:MULTISPECIES: formate dehydrogenase accessory sulfurtransferase FdhD [unclassified Seohaeicola]MDD9706333.1 formate dehydrogenase accessory sulfurtransferase FdhD [Seohaeicola sp. 4SK31]MDD9734040.1 formate dehydrogenase accessory sulfurtransferase FdhD [Seohaeicola sp. SP36]MDM7969188.1 formate dehydrogenase accessory sulfurtransferase FdhD [Paracoccaceae bacterium]
MSRSPLLPHRAPQPSPLPVERPLPEEVPLALVYNGSTLAVMMGTPEDLEDFATGFSLSEGIVTRPADLGEIEVLRHPSGIELRMWLPNNQAHKLAARRRAVTGPVGCGLCGIDSLDQALRQPPPLPDDRLHLTQADLTAAMEGLRACQPLHDETRAVHAAGFYIPGRGIVAAREDVGRHNALDKLCGALARSGIAPETGAVVLTSRVSVDMVQKCAMFGAPCLIAASAPTTAGVALAETAGITLAARAKSGRAQVFTHPARILTGGPQ